MLPESDQVWFVCHLSKQLKVEEGCIFLQLFMVTNLWAMESPAIWDYALLPAAHHRWMPPP